jgi:ADP-ribose pyrophosphatase
MNIYEAIATLDNSVTNPTTGLPEELFLYISRTTPLINVDLLIKDEFGNTLLSWRNECYTGKGWHVPGGIVRFQERLETRINEVVKKEIGTDVIFDPRPVAINQIINHEQKIRGHFISILFSCFLPSTFLPKNDGLSPNDMGYLRWHNCCPDNLLKYHEIYRDYINSRLPFHEVKYESKRS